MNMTAFFFEVSYIVMVSDFMKKENYMFWNQNVKVQTRVLPKIWSINYLGTLLLIDMCLFAVQSPKRIEGTECEVPPSRALW